MIPERRFVAVNGLRLAYLDFGGGGPPAVLHHPTGFLSWTWAPVAQALAKRYRVFAIDARGHGDSDKLAAGYRWQAFIADFVAFVESLGLGRALAVGHSLGATTAAGAAAERPDLFSAVALLDPILFPREFESENRIAVVARKRRETWTSRDEVFRSYRGRGAFAKWRDDVLRLYVDHGFADDRSGVRLKCPPEIEAQVFSMPTDYDVWGMLERVSVPALVVRGAASDAFSARDAAEALRRLPKGKLLTFDGTHMFPMETPEAVAAAILDFTRA